MAKPSDDFVCVLRASSRAHGLGALLKAHPRWRPDIAWKAGTTVYGRERTRDGFNLFIAEGSEWKKVMTATRRRLRALTPMIDEGRKFGADFELDFAVTPGGQFWNRQAWFVPTDLELLAGLGVELRVTAYPGSEPSAPTRSRAKPRRAAPRS